MGRFGDRPQGILEMSLDIHIGPMSLISTNLAVMVADERTPPEVAISEEDQEALRQAVEALEAASFAARLSAVAGRPVELLGQALPPALSETVSSATQVALTRALKYALKRFLKKAP